MDLETVIYEKDGDVGVITLNRPDALNALSLQLTQDLDRAIHLAIDDNARAIVLTATGRAFCSGGDLREMKSMWEKEGRIEAFLEEPLAALHRVIRLIRETPIPFIAAVNGVCAGAGTNLALACDLVVAADNASFNEAFLKIGLTPDCGGTLFPAACGRRKARGRTVHDRRKCVGRAGGSVWNDQSRSSARRPNCRCAVAGKSISSGPDRRHRQSKAVAQCIVLKLSRATACARTRTADRIRKV